MTAKRSADDRRSAHRLGLRAETLAALRLRASGWRVLAQRFACPAGEIDIVARRGDLVAVVEVKARRTLDQALESVTPRQRVRIVRAAEAFRAGRPELSDCSFRFDLIALTGGLWPIWIKDAWRP